MRTVPTGMNASEVEALLRHVASGDVAAHTAVTLLVLNGEEQTNAARMVFHALGGSDATELDAEGRLRYVGSGKLVAAVEHAIAHGLS